MEDTENINIGTEISAASHHYPTSVADNGDDFASAEELMAENRRRNEALVSPGVITIRDLGDMSSAVRSPRQPSPVIGS